MLTPAASASTSSGWAYSRSIRSRTRRSSTRSRRRCSSPFLLLTRQIVPWRGPVVAKWTGDSPSLRRQGYARTEAPQSRLVTARGVRGLRCREKVSNPVQIVLDIVHKVHIVEICVIGLAPLPSKILVVHVHHELRAAIGLILVVPLSGVLKGPHHVVPTVIRLLSLHVSAVCREAAPGHRRCRRGRRTEHEQSAESTCEHDAQLPFH